MRAHNKEPSIGDCLKKTVAACLFSGGKESLYALQMVQQQGVEVEHLIYEIPTFPSPHIVNIEALKTLAESMHKSFTIVKLGTDGVELAETLRKLNVDALVAGDINVPQHVAWLSEICNRAGGVKLLEPLFGKEMLVLFREMFLASPLSPFKATIIGVDTKHLGEEWLGFTLSKDTAAEFLSKTQGVDPLGENGEYHTICVESPLYSKNYKIKSIEKTADGRMVFLHVALIEK
jgi:diphthine-ammonia ligase